MESGTAELNIVLPEAAKEKFRTYFSLLEEKNKLMNLTAISGEDDVTRLHFLDSLALLAIHDFRGARVADIGTGAGFPGLPVLIAEPTVRLTLIDSLGKRVDFLRQVTAALGLSADCLHARAEEAAKEPDLRESFDIAVSRAVARLNVLCELCMPFVEPGGVFIAMKSAASDEEMLEAERAAELLVGRSRKNTTTKSREQILYTERLSSEKSVLRQRSTREDLQRFLNRRYSPCFT